MDQSDAKIERDRPALYQLAKDALRLWPVPQDATLELINISENATFLVSVSDGTKTILRVHRPGYHTQQTIAAELTWMQALSTADVIKTPAIIDGCDGARIQRHQISGQPPHNMVMFAFVEGQEPDQSQSLESLFHHLGGLAARLHLHVMAWPLPAGFTRPDWDIDGIFGGIKRWGNWRQAPYLTPSMHTILEEAEAQVSRLLRAYGKSSDRYGLIHADMRLANLLVKGNDMRRVHVIDFDDCGFGWFMYDFAAGISFIEDDPQVPYLKSAWLAGYQDIRPLSDEDLMMVDTMIMLRRMLLLAWVGSHKDADIVADLEKDFGRVTAQLAERYLKDQRY